MSAHSHGIPWLLSYSKEVVLNESKADFVDENVNIVDKSGIITIGKKHINYTKKVREYCLQKRQYICII